MAFDDIQAEVGLLLTRMQNEPDDRHELYLQIMQKLNELRAYGMPLPEDLVQLSDTWKRNLRRIRRRQKASRVQTTSRRKIVIGRSRQHHRGKPDPVQIDDRINVARQQAERRAQSGGGEGTRFRRSRKSMLEDIAILTGGTVISEDLDQARESTLAILGRGNRVSIDKATRLSVLVAHGSGSSRPSPRNTQVAGNQDRMMRRLIRGRSCRRLYRSRRTDARHWAHIENCHRIETSY